MIIATAGHVDHGKTTLLQAITGINADHIYRKRKCADDRRSGSYAYRRSLTGGYWGLSTYRSRKFCPACWPVSAAVSITRCWWYACDDGVMAQTRAQAYLAILQLTRQPTLAVALTKLTSRKTTRIEVKAKSMRRWRSSAPARDLFTVARRRKRRGIDGSCAGISCALPRAPSATSAFRGDRPGIYRQRRGAGGYRDGAIRRGQRWRDAVADRRG